jgi:hypothetical protein
MLNLSWIVFHVSMEIVTNIQFLVSPSWDHSSMALGEAGMCCALPWPPWSVVLSVLRVDKRLWCLLKKIIPTVLHIVNILMKRGKHTFKIVGISQAFVSHLHSLNAYNFIYERRSYHQYLAELWRQRLCFNYFDWCRPRSRRNYQDKLFLSLFKICKSLDL